MYHSLRWSFYKYRTLVPNSSLCQSVQCLRSSAFCQHLVIARNYYKIRWRTVTLLCRERSSSRSYPKTPSFGVNFSRRHHHWTNSGSSRCENCWRIWQRGCNSINCEPRIHNSLCDIQRRRSSCERNSWSQKRAQVQQWIASKPSRIRKKEKVTRSHKETWAAPSTKETRARLVIFTTRVSLFGWEKVSNWECLFVHRE